MRADSGNIVLCLSIRWSEESDDAAVYGALESIVSRGNATAWESGFGHNFLYINDADVRQGAIGSYGSESVERLERVARKYDPAGVFTKLQPGGHKLFN